MTVIRRVPWTVQPQYPADVARGNPIASGLIVATAPGIALINQADPSVTVGIQSPSIATRAPTQYGIGIGSTTNVDAPIFHIGPYVGNAGFYVGGGAWSVFAFIEPFARQGTTASAILTVQSGSDWSQSAPFQQSSTVDHRYSLTGAYTTIGVPQVFCVARKTSAGSVDRAFYPRVGPASLTHTASITGTGLSILAASSVSLKSVLAIYAWNRVITDAEVAALRQNPWQLFEPRRIIIPVSAGAGGGTIAAAGIASGEAFGLPSLSAGIAAAGIATAEALGQPALGAAAHDIVAAGVTSAQAFGSPALAAGINAADVASAEAFGAAALSLQIVAAGIATAEAVGQPTVAGAAAGTIVAASIASAEAFGSPALAATIGATGIASAQAFGSPSVGGHDVIADGIASAEAFGGPALQLGIVAAGIASAQAFGAVRVGDAVAAREYLRLASHIATQHDYSSPFATQRTLASHIDIEA